MVGKDDDDAVAFAKAQAAMREYNMRTGTDTDGLPTLTAIAAVF